MYNTCIRSVQGDEGKKGCIFRRSSSSNLSFSLSLSLSISISVYLSLFQETISLEVGRNAWNAITARVRSTFDRRKKRIVDHDRQVPGTVWRKKKKGQRARRRNVGHAINVTRNWIFAGVENEARKKGWNAEEYLVFMGSNMKLTISTDRKFVFFCD